MATSQSPFPRAEHLLVPGILDLYEEYRFLTNVTLLFKVDPSEIRLFVGRVSLDEPPGYYAALVHRVDGPATSPDPILEVLIKGGTCRHTHCPYDMKSTIKQLEMELQFAVDDMVVEAESRARGPTEQKRHEER